MSTFRERYGNGPTTWPFSVRVAFTVAVLFLPLNLWAGLVLEWGTPNAAFYLLLAGMTSMAAWPVLRWTWTRTDSSLKADWGVEREVRDAFERDAKGDLQAPPESLLDRDRPPPRW